jgi:DNA processing protein
MPGSEPSREEYEAALGLAWLGVSGGHSVLRLVRQKGAEAVWGASRRCLMEWGATASLIVALERQRKVFDPAEADSILGRAGLRFVPYGASQYPPELGHLDLPPAGLFVRGADEAFERLVSGPRVTIVGTRRASAEGLRATESFASAFCARGVVVVSGMALGVDGRAHQAALASRGVTAAVLGCGADVVYPRRHGWLYRQITKNGIVMSELPPGTAPTQWTFPHRNRLLAALGDAALVIEGSVTSGAIQTANWALALGRPVFSVPGSIFIDGHAGCNKLLYDGAGVAIGPQVTVEDFLLQTRIERGQRLEYESGVSTASEGGSPVNPACVGGARGTRVLEALESGPSVADGLVARTGLAVRELNATLAELELAGLVKRAGPGIYVRAP